ncbi:response regulator receiver protein [filamentous cyanobacterium CCP5]|nr:response regulator receiver protein [filamentous cyanobacterium CCP5]
MPSNTISTVKVTSSLLAFWRHELFAPLNIIQGYAGLILEEIIDENDSQEPDGCVESLSIIQNTSKEIHGDICQILDARIIGTDNSSCDLLSLSHELNRKLAPKLIQIYTLVEDIRSPEFADINSDLQKIINGANTLEELLSDKLNWLINFTSKESSEEKLLTKSDNSKEHSSHHSSLGDIENSLSYIKNQANKRHSAIQGSKILVVDNNKDNQELLYRQLERDNHLVDAVDSGEAAIRLLQERQYDLILLDIIMPGLTGYQVLHAVKKDDQFKDIPVIMISSLNEIDSISRCIELGAEDYLPKPFNFTLLQARVNACLEKKKLQDKEKEFIEQLAEANRQISVLNERLKAENIRLSAELEITRQLQQLILPKTSELEKISDLDIAGFMEPAEEVGGDYYDVHQYNGNINISIGDITGHGLESGLLMIMVQTAVRALIENHETDQKKLLNTLNRIIVNNAKRIESERNLTLLLLNYVKGTLNISGQHEEIIIVRADGTLELIDTANLGFPIGLEEDIEQFIDQTQLHLKSGDIVVLYTDGVTEAEDEKGDQYGIDRFCQVIVDYQNHSANTIKQAVVSDLKEHIGNNKLLDDFTLLVLKQR